MLYALMFRRSRTPDGGRMPVLTPRGLKLLGALLVLLGLVLPLYSCRARSVTAVGREVPSASAGAVPLRPGASAPAGSAPQKHYYYFFSDFSADDVVDWFRLGGFLWPAAAAWGADRLKRRWSRRLFRGLEPVLVLETALSLSIGAMFGTKEIGFWVAWPGLVLYGAGAAWADLAALEAWKPGLGKGKRRLAAAGICAAFLAGSVVSVLAFFDWFRR